MTDFTRWLYANYIWPHLEAQDATGYETPLSLLEGCLDDALKKEYHRTLEFYAGHAFLLGVRTGAELGAEMPGLSARRIQSN